MEDLNMSVCNICGGNEFISGPGGRLSLTGKPPKCKGCSSLERHRCLREIYLQLNNFMPFKKMSALQISKDRAIDPEWFASHELSIYGGDNSIDIQNIGRQDNRYDVVICNHVLEHIENDYLALKELMRVSSDSGFFQLAVPDPCYLKKTQDWGYPDENKHGHYRMYGIDIEERFEKVFSSEVEKIKVFVVDPVTGLNDLFFFFTRSLKVASLIKGISE
ncbi:MAG: class I SAM-dependent methyltransferase [Pleurocapsa sp. SU_5_0]|nr:class I SAM-dependent methyltransferase [Pleurocapsa sp. SU_5_0]